jgi:pSer/pThr/pTyr-binding forkhead associated (FHA) protein
MSLCPRCHTDAPLGASACPTCGGKLASWGTMTVGPEQMAGAVKPKVTVRVVRADGGSEMALALRKDVALAGSAGDIVLTEDPFVARTQAKIYFSGAQLMVEDVGGGNGVFLRLRTEAYLRPGEQLRCGRQLLMFEPLAPPPSQAPKVWGSPDYGCKVRLVQMLEGGRRGDAYPLKDGDNALGREVGDVTFPGDGFVSGRHAVLTVAADKVKVKDLGSSNGTFIRLDAPTPLTNGDQLLIGRQLLKMEIA